MEAVPPSSGLNFSPEDGGSMSLRKAGWYPRRSLHGVTTQKTIIDNFTAMRT
jgi:hypothetical protein